jgi:protein involved in polysaccharide export with SLBB domain
LRSPPPLLLLRLPARAAQDPVSPGGAPLPAGPGAPAAPGPAAPALPAPGPVAPGPTSPSGSAAPSPYVSPFATPQAPNGVPGALLSIPADYRLDIGDLVEIKVLFRLLKGTNLDATVPIPADGLLRLSRLKAPVNARLLTCDELSEALRRAWSHQFRLQPGQVVVRVANPRLRKINLMGNGIENGVVGLQPGWRIADVIVATGGNPYPERAKLVVTNKQRPAPVTVDLVQALANPESPANIALLEGDVVTVTVPKAERLIVYGEGPRGTHNIDERYGLRLALAGLGYSTTNATGSLRDAMIVRKVSKAIRPRRTR